MSKKLISEVYKNFYELRRPPLRATTIKMSASYRKTIIRIVQCVFVGPSSGDAQIVHSRNSDDENHAVCAHALYDFLGNDKSI